MTRKKYLISMIISAVIALFAIIGCIALWFQFEYARDNYTGRIETLNEQLNSQNSAILDANRQISSAADTILECSKAAASVNAEISKAHYLIKSIADSRNQTQPDDGKKVCYLTFDDGPSDNTLKILDVLDKYKIKATFFVIHDTANPNYLPKIAERGHTIGLHSYTHNYSKIYSSTNAFFDDLNRIGNLVKQKTGIDSKVIRFPGGSSNTVSKQYSHKIMSKLTTQVVEKGYTYFDWNCDSGDAIANNISPAKLLNNVKNSSKGKNKITILMHDSGAKRTTAEALPSIIEYLKSQGYSFAKLDENTPPAHHGINN